MLKYFGLMLRSKKGMSTVEIAIIVAVLVSVALIFRESIMSFVNSMMSNIFPDANDLTNSVK